MATLSPSNRGKPLIGVTDPGATIMVCTGGRAAL